MKIIWALCFAFLSSSCIAQVYKCAGSGGKTVYSDSPCSATAEKINTAPSSGGFTGAKQVPVEDMPVNLDEAPTECKFGYYTYGDEKGKLLSDRAKAECMRNIQLKKAGRGTEVSTEAYALWHDHHQIKSGQRNAVRTLNCIPNGYGGARCN
jgi:hypothetical protein